MTRPDGPKLVLSQAELGLAWLLLVLVLELSNLFGSSHSVQSVHSVQCTLCTVYTLYSVHIQCLRDCSHSAVIVSCERRGYSNIR